MNLMSRALTFLLFLGMALMQQGCDQADENASKYGETTFVLFNARDVGTDMHVELKKNDTQRFDHYVPYAQSVQETVRWIRDDRFELNYEQEFGFDVKQKTLVPFDGAWLIVSFGNDRDRQVAPFSLHGPQDDTMNYPRAALLLLNAYDKEPNDDAIKLIAVNDRDRYESSPMRTGDSARNDEFIANDLTSLRIEDAQTGKLLFETFYAIAPNRAYGIIIYEDPNVLSSPTLKIIELPVR